MLEIRRSAAATNFLRMRLFVLSAVGGYLLWSARLSDNPSPFWVGLGVLILLWAGALMCIVLRPIRLQLTPEGVFAQTTFFRHQFPWEALKWVDFSWNHDAALMCYAKPDSDKEGLVVLKRNTITDIQRSDAYSYILEHRPDIPKANPVPVVEFRRSKI
jgi:hypothetical protein